MGNGAKTKRFVYYSLVVYQLSSEMIEDAVRTLELNVTLFKDFYNKWDGVSIPRSYDYYEDSEDAIYLELPAWHK